MSLLPSELCETRPRSTTAQTVFRVDIVPVSQARWETCSVEGLGTLVKTAVYWLSGEALTEPMVQTLAQEALVDPIMQVAHVSSSQSPSAPTFSGYKDVTMALEKQFLPGVTDNLAHTVLESFQMIFPQSQGTFEVASGWVYWTTEPVQSPDSLVDRLAYRLYNPLVESLTALPVSTLASVQSRYHLPTVHLTQADKVNIVSLAGSDEALMQISRKGNLALTLDEMQVIRDYYQRPEIQAERTQKGLSLWPTDVELEVLAQTWSEHCKHKIFAAHITYTDWTIPEVPIQSEIDGLFKTYIAGSTKQLLAKRPDLLSIFKDNAGVLRWDDNWGVCFKVETHNSPSALEPYGGALTGIVGVNRDILGTGLGAKPLFNTDVFCFAHPETPHVKRPTMLPPESILMGVRKGVEDGGNKSGIPTVNGSLFFDPRYRAKPLVFCGTGGMLPLDVAGLNGVEKFTKVGDAIVMAGGRVGKDGIHGATFSSEALNQDSPLSAVQIGDPITQKRLADFQMAARDKGLLTGVTDNGAGGLSSSVGEMAELTDGARLYLDKVPLKYPGLQPFEIIISESQERMTYSTDQVEALLALAQEYDVELSVIGEFTDSGALEIYHKDQPVAVLPLDFLHHGLPQMKLEAEWANPRSRTIRGNPSKDWNRLLLSMLSDANVCSREALIRQYDHEVQGHSVLKPLGGPLQTSPMDAAVLQPNFDDAKGLVVSNGMCPQLSDWDAYHMSACAIDEAVRNAVAVGAQLNTIALLDNFCWPDPLPSARNKEAHHKLAQLVRACQAISDMALAFETPFISGKDSMKNDFDDGDFRLSIPPTLLISAIGTMPNASKAVSMDFKASGDAVYLLGKTSWHHGASLYYNKMGWYCPYPPQVDKVLARKLYETVFTAIQNGWIRSCHDLSEGGLLVSLAESLLGTDLGLDVSLQHLLEASPELRWDEALTSESPSRFVISVAPQHQAQVEALFHEIPCLALGHLNASGRFRLWPAAASQDPVLDIETAKLRNAWQTPPAPCYALEDVQ